MPNKPKRKRMRTCRYCECDISDLHPKCLACYSPECREKFEANRIRIIKDRSAIWHKIHDGKKSGTNGRRCQLPSWHKILENGRRFFCGDLCQSRFVGENRFDGDFMFA